jgi:hypothetical protein
LMLAHLQAAVDRATDCARASPDGDPIGAFLTLASCHTSHALSGLSSVFTAQSTPSRLLSAQRGGKLDFVGDPLCKVYCVLFCYLHHIQQQE